MCTDMCYSRWDALSMSCLLSCRPKAGQILLIMLSLKIACLHCSVLVYPEGFIYAFCLISYYMLDV